MRKDLISAALGIVVFTILLGLGYPLAVTGISQVAFPDKADGSLVADGTSRLLARPWKGGGYFRPRPSQTDYDAEGTFFSNRGPNQASAKLFYRDQLAAYLRRERAYAPGLGAEDVPVDAVTTSASGVDPHISKANAAIQARRIAALRDLSIERVTALVDDNTDGRFLGVLGEAGVNTTTLNLALDKEAPVR